MEQKKPKTTVAISVCGLFIALSVVIMLIAHIGVLSYAVPALAGALLVIIYLELGVKNAFIVYLAVSVLSFIIGVQPDAFLCYALFFGYYPFVKAYLERIKSKTVQWIVKVALFTVAFSLVLLLGMYVFGVPIDDMGYGIWYLVGLGIGLELMFVLYDIALTRVITLYIYRYQANFKKLMRINKK